LTNDMVSISSLDGMDQYSYHYLENDPLVSVMLHALWLKATHDPIKYKSLRAR